MRNVTHAAAAAAVLMLASPALAIYQEPTVPQTDRSEQIPGSSIKLDRDSDTPPTEEKKAKKEVKPREPERTPRQATRKPPKEDQTDKAMSPETGRAIGRVIEFGLGGRMGMGGHGGDHGMMGGDRGMRDR
ncbi:MAG: hypothetical protein ACLPX7_16545 [Xanthobacteraceae bacterium]